MLHLEAPWPDSLVFPHTQRLEILYLHTDGHALFTAFSSPFISPDRIFTNHETHPPLSFLVSGRDEINAHNLNCFGSRRQEEDGRGTQDGTWISHLPVTGCFVLLQSPQHSLYHDVWEQDFCSMIHELEFKPGFCIQFF